MAEKCGHPFVHKTVKAKILDDIFNNHWNEKCQEMINSFKNTSSLNLKSLELSELIHIWNTCEKSMSNEENKRPIANNNTVVNAGGETYCIRCGQHHVKNKCPAQGKQCSICKNLNHFETQCKAAYIRNCGKCGTDHIQSSCPAFGSKCSQCGKFNHFSSKCQTSTNEKHCKQIKNNPSTSIGEKMNLIGPNRDVYVNNCPKCGTIHQKSHCIAFGSTCSKCGKPNHFASKCHTLQVENCSRCGQNHFISACPAVGKLCSLCKKPNHSESKCIYKAK